MVKQKRRKINNYDIITLQGKYSDRGSEAMFFKMSKNSKFGIKAYESFIESETAYNGQKKAAAKGLAPKVGKQLIIKRDIVSTYRNNDGIMFGYETQIAKPVRNGYKNKTWKEQAAGLQKALRAMDMGYDFRPDNCGIINGTLVFVDFGVISFDPEYA